MPDEPLTGPALIELPEATLVVRPGWRANAHGADIVLQREAQR
jgi:N-methylhydantoinase A/oxoprolinase/acetone carboxylase beta subunit